MSSPSPVGILLDDGWSIGGKPHGGYLLRLVVERVLTAEHPHPLAVSAHYIRSPSTTEPVEITTERLRVGRRVASTRARLAQAGAAVIEVLVSHGTLAGREARWVDGTRPPALPPPEQCLAAEADQGDGPRVGHLDHIEMRLHPDSYAAVGAELRAWLRRTDGAPASVLDLLVFADALPPVTHGLGMTGWAPTVELTVLLRTLPAAGWIRAVQRARLLHDGWLDEDCELWDSAGRLVVQARQLAGYREP